MTPTSPYRRIKWYDEGTSSFSFTIHEGRPSLWLQSLLPAVTLAESGESEQRVEQDAGQGDAALEEDLQEDD